VRKIAVFPSK
jgi:up-regulated protein 5